LFLVPGSVADAADLWASADWAKELAQSWKQAEAVRGRALIVDLTETLFIDQTGKPSSARRGTILSSVLALLFATTVRAAQPHRTATPVRLTLCNAVEMALKQNPEVPIANLNTAVTTKAKSQGRSLWPVRASNFRGGGFYFLRDLIAKAGLLLGQLLQIEFGGPPRRESGRQARDRFQAGVANNIEVITAQDELARANDNQIVALYRYN
jgi:hypothetical protein